MQQRVSSSKKIIAHFALLTCLCFATQAYTCNASVIEGWVSLVLNAVGTIAPLVNPLIGAIATLAGKTLTQVQVNSINAKLTQVAADAGLLQSAINAATNPPGQSDLQKINSIESDISTNLNAAVLAANGVSDAASQMQILAAVQSLIATVQKIEQAIPTAGPTPGTVTARKRTESIARLKSDLDPAAIKARYNAAISKKTGNAAVDDAFAKAVVK